jgi:hypothetical protein
MAAATAVVVRAAEVATAPPGEAGEEPPVEGVELGDPVLGDLDGDLLVLRGLGFGGHLDPFLVCWYEGQYKQVNT